MAQNNYEIGGNLNGQEFNQPADIPLGFQNFQQTQGVQAEHRRIGGQLGAAGNLYGQAARGALQAASSNPRMQGLFAGQNRQLAGSLNRAGVRGGAARSAGRQLRSEQADILGRMQSQRAAMLGQLAGQFGGTALGAGQFAMSPFMMERDIGAGRASSRRQRHSQDAGSGGMGGALGSLLGAGAGMAMGLPPQVGASAGGMLGGMFDTPGTVQMPQSPGMVGPPQTASNWWQNYQNQNPWGGGQNMQPAPAWNPAWPGG